MARKRGRSVRAQHRPENEGRRRQSDHGRPRFHRRRLRLDFRREHERHPDPDRPLHDGDLRSSRCGISRGCGRRKRDLDGRRTGPRSRKPSRLRRDLGLAGRFHPVCRRDRARSRVALDGKLGSLWRFDPRTGHVRIRLGFDPGGLAFGLGRLWVTTTAATRSPRSICARIRSCAGSKSVTSPSASPSANDRYGPRTTERAPSRSSTPRQEGLSRRSPSGLIQS